MLTCKELAEHSSAYLEKDLSLRMRLSLAFHLLLCGNCRGFMNQLKKSIVYFNGLPQPELDEAQAELMVKNIIDKAKL